MFIKITTSYKWSLKACKRELNLNTPLWVLDFLSDEVQGVPARVGEQGGVQGQGDVSGVTRRPLEETLKVFCTTFKIKHTRKLNYCTDKLVLWNKQKLKELWFEFGNEHLISVTESICIMHEHVLGVIQKKTLIFPEQRVLCKLPVIQRLLTEEQHGSFYQFIVTD